MNSEVINQIQESEKIGISFHTSPDGDSIGSALALMQILRKLKKEAYILSKESIPKMLSFLPYATEITGNSFKVKEGTDCVIVLDCGNIERINAELDFQDKSYSVINIDHHISNDRYGDINYVNTDVPAVGEIIFDMLKSINIDLDKDIASCIYTSLLTDTGSFKYPGTTLNTHRVAGELIKTGIDFTNIHRIIFDNKEFNKVKLIGKVIDSMELLCRDKVCFMYLRKDMLEELGLQDEDSSDVIYFGTIIESVDVTVLIKEKGNLLKVGLRSKEIVDVRNIAESFGGGGHIRASGFSTNLSVDEVKEKLIKILDKELM